MEAYLCVINILAFLAYGEDKRRAMCGGWRISEKTLLLLAAAGGGAGAFLGMQIFRHKTRHLKFTLGVPALAGAWILALVFIR